MGKERSFFYILILIILFSLAIRMPALVIPHIENDEIIYQTLTFQVLTNPSHYSLQGTSILKILPQQAYDRPVFHSPPLFVFCLAFITILFGKTWMIMVSIVSGVLTIILTYDICRKLYHEKKALMSAIISFCCPLLLFCSTRILIDALLVFLVTLTIWSFLLALKSNQKSYFIVSGIIFGLTLLTKQSGVLILLTCVYILLKDGFSKQKFVFFIYFLFTAILVCSPWYIYFYKTYGTLFPSWTSSFESIEMFSFIKMTVHRPWHFYVTHIILIAPIYLFAFMNILYVLKNKRINAEIIWALSFLIPLSYLGISGLGFQTRYVAPAIPALAILSAHLLDTENKWVGVWGVLFLSLGLLTGILNSLIFKPADVFPFYFFFNR